LPFSEDETAKIIKSKCKKTSKKLKAAKPEVKDETIKSEGELEPVASSSTIQKEV
jgi:hypothetical protein